MRSKALIYVETWVGGGHLQVAAHGAKALSEAGVDVTVATSAGEMAEGFDFGADVQRVDLPRWALQGSKEATLTLVGQTFKVDRHAVEAALTKLATGEPLSGAEPWHGPLADVFAQRQQALREAAKDADAVVTEFWPLGGRSLVNSELDAFLASDRPVTQKVVALERDIVFPGPDAEARVERVNKHIDRVLVRGDRSVAAIEDTFSATKNIGKPISYVGFFGRPMPPRQPMQESERPVIVTAGGGARPQDIKLYEAAIAAASTSSLSQHPWRLFIPVGTSPKTIDRLKAKAAASPANITIEANASSGAFRQLIADAALVVTQAGYNTTLDLTTGGIPAVYVPAYDGGGDREKNEQVQRARVMSRLTGAAVLLQEEADQDGKLATAIDLAIASKPRPVALPVDGARGFAMTLCELMKR